MRHHQYKEDFKFVKNPIDFNKYTDKNMLRFCLGATLYMPGTKDFAPVILNKSMPGLTSMVMCFEDACKEEDVPQAEENVLHFLESIADSLDNGKLTYDDIPLIFCRVRSPEQFEEFSKRLEKKHLKILTGINFPKFNSENGERYCAHLKYINEKLGDILYGMPILEDRSIAFKDSRYNELKEIKNILDKYSEIILHIRVGATDFSSYFGVRRGIEYTIYDILTVRDILTDILNVFSRDNEYIVSGPVWEYFLVSKDMKFKKLSDDKFDRSLLMREPIVNDAVDGLLRELILDRANGFVGKTVIHPTHIRYVNAMHAVTSEEYYDAVQILNTSDGVIKSAKANKMNEIRPHRSWAEKVIMRSKAYGVIENEASYFELFSE
jgi:citrate lyase beta subunit